MWYICDLLSLGESYSTNRSCFLNDLHRLLKGYDGKTFPISIPAIRIKEQSDQQVMLFLLGRGTVAVDWKDGGTDD